MNAKPTPNYRQIRGSDITPPPELVQQWRNEGYILHSPVAISIYVATRAAQYGADQELEACCEWLSACGCESYGRELRTARRPKPPSLKEQALARLALLELVVADLEKAGLVPFHEKDDSIRRALEQLDD